MAKERKVASKVFANRDTPTTLKRKREHGELDIAGSSTTKRDNTAVVQHERQKSRTPSNPRAHFGTRLEQGATPGNPYADRRSMSPTRPIIRNRSQPEDGPSAQLHAETKAALEHGDAARSPYSNKRQKLHRSQSPNGRDGHGRPAETGLTECLDDLVVAGPSTAKSTKSASTKTQTKTLAQRSGSISTFDDIGLAPEKALFPFSLADQLTDDQVCQQMDDLRSAVQDLAKTCPSLPVRNKQNVLRQLLTEENERLVRYIGCLVIGGKNGEQDWIELLADTTCRQALVSGILGRALKENVFNELFFGGDGRLVKALGELEQEQEYQDGFYRTRQRAMKIGTYKPKQIEGPDFRTAIVRVTLQLEQLLRPFWELGSGSRQAWTTGGNRVKVAGIVLTAARLNRLIRSRGDVVMYWPPTFKDEEFDPVRMECLNLRAMISESPYDKKSDKGFDRAVLREGHEHEGEAIVRVVCFPGLVAYRQHGGALAKQELLDEENEARERDGRGKLPPDVQRHRRIIASQEKTLTGDEGFRTRVISKTVVLLHWGKQRLLTKEAGTSRHIDAMKGKGVGMKKYEDDYVGFVELYDLYEQAQQKDAQGAPGILSGFTGWLSRSASAEPAAKTANGVHRPQSRAR